MVFILRTGIDDGNLAAPHDVGVGALEGERPRIVAGHAPHQRRVPDFQEGLDRRVRIAEQAARLDHVLFAGCTHEPAVALAEELLAVAPDGLARVFYSDDGSTAVEVALKIALQAHRHAGEAERQVFVALEGAYHGDTFGAMAVGVGAGWMLEEIALLGHPVPGRGRRLDEMLEIIRAFWTRESVEFHGEFVDLTLDPPRASTVNGTCPPMYFGGFSPAAKDVAAAEADRIEHRPDNLLIVTVEELASTGMDVWLSALAYGAAVALNYGDEGQALAQELLLSAGFPEHRSFLSAAAARQCAGGV